MVFNLKCLDCILYKNSFNLSKNEKVTAVVHELLGQPLYMSRAPGHGACLKSVSRAIIMQGFILPAITAAEKCTLFLDST